MAKIPKVLQQHIDTAFPANVCLLGSVLPNGFAQVTPRGGTMVFDDEHIGLWERGTGSTADNMKDGTKLTIEHKFTTSPAILPATDYPALLQLETALEKKDSRLFLLQAQD